MCINAIFIFVCSVILGSFQYLLTCWQNSIEMPKSRQYHRKSRIFSLQIKYEESHKHPTSSKHFAPRTKSMPFIEGSECIFTHVNRSCEEEKKMTQDAENPSRRCVSIIHPLKAMYKQWHTFNHQLFASKQQIKDNKTKCKHNRTQSNRETSRQLMWHNRLIFHTIFFSLLIICESISNKFISIGLPVRWNGHDVHSPRRSQLMPIDCVDENAVTDRL